MILNTNLLLWIVYIGLLLNVLVFMHESIQKNKSAEFFSSLALFVLLLLVIFI